MPTSYGSQSKESVICTCLELHYAAWVLSFPAAVSVEFHSSSSGEYSRSWRCDVVAGCPDEVVCHCCTLQHVCLHKYLYSSQIRNYPIIRLQSHASCVWQRFGDQRFASRSVNKATLVPHAARRAGGFCLLDYLYSPSLIGVTKRLRCFVGDSEKLFSS